MINNKEDEFTEELFQSLLSRNQIAMERSTLIVFLYYEILFSNRFKHYIQRHIQHHIRKYKN